MQKWRRKRDACESADEPTAKKPLQEDTEDESCTFSTSISDSRTIGPILETNQEGISSIPEDKNITESKGHCDQESNLCPECNIKASRNIRRCLEEWVESEFISSLAVSRLLAIMREDFPHLPKTGKILRKQGSDFSVHVIEDHGIYFHFTLWREQLLQYCKQQQIQDDIILMINIDGIPLANVNRVHSAYPILIKIRGHDKIFATGLYCTTTTAQTLPSAHEFLDQFLPDLESLMTNGIEVPEGKIKIKPLFVCDAPVR